jgi:hypothetical protein|tara:strand:- start:389 stop:775 length:387 start_codon:yes stop_codon:yes gene_type:complete
LKISKNLSWIDISPPQNGCFQTTQLKKTNNNMADMNMESTEEQTEVDMGDLRLLQGCCCMVAGLYTPSFRQCFGGSCKGEALCFGGESLCCKLTDSATNEDKECCILSEQKIVCKRPEVVSNFLICNL